MLFLGLVATIVPALAAVQVTYATIDVPGANATEAHGINRFGPLLRSSEIVGTYQDAQGTHGFLLSNGHYTALNVPGGHDTSALGINALHQIVGSYTGSDGNTHGFRYTAGAYTKLTCPIGRGSGPFDFTPNGINNAGEIVGAAGVAGLVYVNGRCIFPVRQNALDIYAINNAGEAAATIVDAVHATHGQTLFPAASNEAETQLDVPGAAATWATGINDSGDVVGFDKFGTRLFVPVNGFLYANGAYTTIDFPGAFRTYPYGVNDSALFGSSYGIVGTYSGFFGAQHGFVASVSPVLSSRP